MEKKMTFDYIIVGTGPAGAVLAKILSDHKKRRCLCLRPVITATRTYRSGIQLMLWNSRKTFFPNIFGKEKVSRKKALMIDPLSGPGKSNGDGGKADCRDGKSYWISENT